jgi:hypothetical protein
METGLLTVEEQKQLHKFWERMTAERDAVRSKALELEFQQLVAQVMEQVHLRESEKK